MDARVDRVEDQLGLGRGQHARKDHQDAERREDDRADEDEAHDDQQNVVGGFGAVGLDPEGAILDGDLGDGLVLAVDLVERAPGGLVADQLPVAEVERAVRDPAQFGVELVLQTCFLDP